MRPREKPGLLKPESPLLERISNSPRSLHGKKEGSVLQSPPPWGLCSATLQPSQTPIQIGHLKNQTFGSSSCEFSFKGQTIRGLKENRTKSRQVPSAPSFFLNAQERNVTYRQERGFVKPRKATRRTTRAILQDPRGGQGLARPRLTRGRLTKPSATQGQSAL